MAEHGRQSGVSLALERQQVSGQPALAVEDVQRSFGHARGDRKLRAEMAFDAVQDVLTLVEGHREVRITSAYAPPYGGASGHSAAIASVSARSGSAGSARDTARRGSARSS